MFPRTLGVALALALTLSAGPAGAQLPLFDSTIVASRVTPRPSPRIALAPGDVPEIVYGVTTAGVTAAVRATIGPSVAYDTIATDLASNARPLWALAPGGAPRSAWFRADGRFVCAAREPAGWVEDSSLVDVVPGLYCQQELAVDPLSGEPRVAFTLPGSGATGWLHYARRDAGSWSVADVDTVPVCGYPISLALDAAGLPWIAYDSPGGDTLLLAHRESPDGPFTREVVAVSTPSEGGSRWYWSTSLALDPASGQPRIAWYLMEAIGGNNVIGFSSRDAGGSWTEHVVYEPSPQPHAVELELDALGAPTVAYTIETTVFAGAVPRVGTGDASGATWYSVRVARQDGLGAFWEDAVPLYNMAMERGGLAVASDRSVSLVVRSMSLNDVIYVRGDPGRTDVAPTAPALALSAPAPNPTRSGQPVRIAFALSRADVIACEIFDVSGRRVAALGPRAFPAGPGSLEWAPRGLGAGVYLLRVRMGSGGRAARRLAVLD